MWKTLAAIVSKWPIQSVRCASTAAAGGGPPELLTRTSTPPAATREAIASFTLSMSERSSCSGMTAPAVGASSEAQAEMAEVLRAAA